MQMPSGDFNSQMTPGDIQKASFVTRLYGTHNQRGPYMYPQSPYALVGLGDIVPMAAMQPIDEETLFTNLPTQSPLGTSSAPLGSAGFPTFQATAPSTPGTVLGPAGSTVPELSTASVNAPNAVTTSYTSAYGTPGASGPGGPDSSVMASGGPPAATLDQAQGGQPAGPITYTNPWPTIISPPPNATAAPAAPPSILCEFGAWVNQNPLLALAGTVGIYFLLKGGKKR